MTNQPAPAALRLAEELEHDPGINRPSVVAELRRLHARVQVLEAALFAYASEFEPNDDGDPDVGSIHANIRAMKAKLASIGVGGVLEGAARLEFAMQHGMPMEREHPEALRLAEGIESDMSCDGDAEIAAELRRLHAENVTLQHGYDAARMEIEGLRDRVQELGAMLRENCNRRIVELESQLEAQPAPSAAVALSDDLRDRLVAISGAIADQDDRAAQAMLREILKAPQPTPTPQADSQPAPVRDYPPLPDFDTVEQHIYGACRRYITQDMLEPIHNLIRDAIDADRAARKQGGAA